jgi:predicted Holliday junction resolvase-like endonuclease
MNIEIITLVLNFFIIPALIIIFKMNNKIIELNTRLNTKKKNIELLFKNDKEYLRNINEINVSLKVTQETLKNILERIK